MREDIYSKNVDIYSKNVVENLVEGTDFLENLVEGILVNGYRGMWILFGASPMLGLSEELYRQFQSGNYDRVIESGAMGLFLTGIASFIAYGAYKISSPEDF